jgi:hypothetical protein
MCPYLLSLKVGSLRYSIQPYFVLLYKDKRKKSHKGQARSRGKALEKADITGDFSSRARSTNPSQP